MNIFYLLSPILGLLMKFIYGLVGNYGITIILFTIVVRLLCFPLQIMQQKNTAKMSAFQPMVTEIQKKYAKDQQRQQQELMRLQQEYGYNPTAGCLPMMVNMLVLFGVIGAVYYPLQYILSIPRESITAIMDTLGIVNRLTGETTIIQNIHQGMSFAQLSAEQTAAIADFNVNFFGLDLCVVPTLGFNLTVILPAIACVSMLFTNAYTMRASGQEMPGNMKMMTTMMNLFFVYFCFTVPMAFSLYYCISNVLMLAQTVICKKIYDPEKMKAQVVEEMNAKKKEKNKRSVITVTDAKTGEKTEKTVSAEELARIRLERARKMDEELYKDEITEESLLKAKEGK